jgi:hypothetical protein
LEPFSLGAIIATRLFRQAGLLSAIPFVLLVGPVLGYYLGSAADRRWTIAPWGVGVGIALGLLASARATIQLIRQARDLQPHE